MYSKSICMILILGILFPAIPLSGRIQNLDRVVAVINEEIITLSDIDKAILIYPVFRAPDESDRNLYLRVLNDLIHYKIAWLEYRQDMNLTPEDYNPLQTAIINKVGSLQKLVTLLKRFDMEWIDFKSFIQERVVYEKVLKDNFQMKINVPFQQIDDFYNRRYLPAQKQLNLEPRSLVEMAPVIEKHIRTQLTEERLSDWLREIKQSYRIVNHLIKESS